MHFKPSDDGKVIDGKVVVYLKPRRSAGEPAAPEKPPEKPPADEAVGKEAAGAGKKKEDQPAPITNLRWAVGAANHGDEVGMLADAPAGKSLLFTVERRSANGQWQAVGSVKAAIAGGTARASMKLEHSGSIDLEHCRFRARLL